MSERKARQIVDVITANMVKAGYPVELTNKRGHKPDFIPTDTYAGWDTEYFEDNLARTLVGGWHSKGAIIQLVKEIRSHAGHS